jgi:hypothetical protein
MAEAQRSSDGTAVVVDLGDMIATNGEVNADGSVGHREAPWLRRTARRRHSQVGHSRPCLRKEATPQSCYTCPVGAAGSG